MLKQLFAREDIDNTVRGLAAAIERDYHDEEILFVCILKGSFMFMSDLIRNIKNPSRIDFMRVSSYGSRMETSGEVTITKDLEEDIKDKNVIIVEDIIDSGLTLKRIMDILLKRSPKSLKVCALLDKRARREVEMEGDYVGLTIDDGFVVGYGIDYAEQYRNLPEIWVVEKDDDASKP